MPNTPTEREMAQAVGMMDDAPATNATDEATLISLLKKLVDQNEQLKTNQQSQQTTLNSIQTTLQGTLNVSIG